MGRGGGGGSLLNWPMLDSRFWPSPSLESSGSVLISIHIGSCGCFIPDSTCNQKTLGADCASCLMGQSNRLVGEGWEGEVG